MRVDVTITRRDIFHVNIYMIPRLLVTWVVIGVIFFFFLFGIYGRIESPFPQRELASLLSTVIILVPFLALIYVPACLVAAIAATERLGLGWHRYELTELGLRETTNVNEEILKWAGIVNIRQNNSYLFIQKNFLQFHVRPVRFFDQLLDADQFCTELVRRMRLANNGDN